MNVVILQANNPGVYTTATGNNTYLFAGGEPALIDAGVGDASHVAAIEAHLNGAALARVIVTHAHSDHAGGAQALAARWPAARFLKMPWPDRDARYPVAWQPLRDGEVVRAGDIDLEAIHTPGHAPDHICLWHAATRSLFCGDLATRGTTVVIPGGRGGHLNDYLRSLERVIALKPAVLFPAHGPAIYDVERTLRLYLVHRRQREQQILSAVRQQPRTVNALVALLYPTLHPQLEGAARDSILAHLLKLQEEGRVVEEKEGDSHTYSAR